ncbi:TP53 regulating kinase [Cladochytrium tenue]|nr:TP53 regulating kinase [Cladochytrium tenue]
MQLLAQGAEARVFATSLAGTPAIVKERFAKLAMSHLATRSQLPRMFPDRPPPSSSGYRHPTLDANLTARRLVQEARSLQRCLRAGLDVPAVYYVEPTGGGASGNGGRVLVMERVAGMAGQGDPGPPPRGGLGKVGATEVALALARRVGACLARMHDLDVVHGDLTTSNMMLREGSLALVLIDFGLSFVSALTEDKAVDLYVLERALATAHGGADAGKFSGYVAGKET